MPIYEYRCRKCNHVFEIIQSINSPVFTACENCGGPCVKQMSTAQIKAFEPHMVTDIDHEPVFVRNSTELNDALKKHNDTKLAHDVGKLRAY